MTLQGVVVPIFQKRKTEAHGGGTVQRGTLRRAGVPSRLSNSQQHWLQQTRTEPWLNTPPVSPVMQLFSFQELGELENYKAPKSNPIKSFFKKHNRLHKSAERNLFSESVKRLICSKWSWPDIPQPPCRQTGSNPQEGAGSAFQASASPAVCGLTPTPAP